MVLAIYTLKGSLSDRKTMPWTSRNHIGKPLHHHGKPNSNTIIMLETKRLTRQCQSAFEFIFNKDNSITD